MATEGSVMSPGTLGSGNYDEFERDFEALLREQNQTGLDRERELNLYRSGSAPPTVEGARAARIAAGNGVVSEEEMRAHPAYLSYYYSNENLNPRLPHPKVSREDWRVARRFSTAVGEVGDQRGRRDPWEGGRGGSGSSLFSFQPGITAPNGEEMERLQRQSPSRLPHSPEWLERSSDGLIGLGDVRLGARRKSMTDTMQEDFVRPNSLSGHVSRPVSRNAFNTAVDPIGVSDAQLAQLHNDMESVDNMYSGATSNGLVRVQSFGSTMSHSFASAVGSSMARSTTPDPQLVRRLPSPCLPTLGGGRVSDVDKKILSNGFTGSSSSDDMASALSGLKLTDKITEDLLFNIPSINVAQTEPSSSTVPLRAYNEFTKSTSTSNDQINLPKRLPSADGFRKGAIGSTSFARSSGHYQTDRASIDFGGRDSNTYSPNHSDAGTDGQYFSRIGNQLGSDFQVPINDPLYAQYLQRASDSAAQAPGSLSDPSLARNYLGNSLMDLPPGYQEAYLAALLGQQKLHYGSPFLGKSGSFNNGLYHNPTFGLGLPYPNQLSGSVLSSLGSPIRQNDRISRIPSMSRSASGGSKGSWNHENGIEEGFTLSLLEELKSNKTRSFELSEIVGHVVEFSGDQYGSRFIQQKLETGSVEEKNSIFPEILPHARVLMTDVFGNYVIQKFFEHGTESQRNQLADQLMGYVLPLSLQMYGCRVIQKALEVVDVDLQTQMVAELDGSVMKCVRDQNGNHVIQKCIECVPQERIQFIVSSFYGQVVALSTHPYGCRVIQRVLEHCDDALTQGIMMQEILQSVSTLAQDQYGNYVVQHVLQHGKPEERSSIISKLTGQIVKMSQQKFASNVVEKCLTYGTPEERLLLIDEMLGTTDENEPLQAMMKDQFGNYVVQKVLETCDDQKLELIISRIKAHLNALKKYTYGKHIVARVEKLIATGERRIGMAANSA